jgi:hypothetical protein
MIVMVALGFLLLEHKIPPQSRTTFDLFAELSLEARKQARSCIALGTLYTQSIYPRSVTLAAIMPSITRKITNLIKTTSLKN